MTSNQASDSSPGLADLPPLAPDRPSDSASTSTGDKIVTSYDDSLVSASAPVKPDLFSNLPPEILAKIWEQPHIFLKKHPGPICRAFVPFQRPIIFRAIYSGSLASLKRLRDLFVDDPSLARYCTAFGTRNFLHYFKPLYHSSDQQMEIRSCLDSIFPLLVNVEDLSISDLGNALNLVLSKEVAQTCFRKLKSLSVWLEPDIMQATTPLRIWKVQNYENLKHYPALNYLSVNWHSSCNPPIIGAARSNFPTVSLGTQITSLRLNILLDRHFTPCLIKSLPKLEELSVTPCPAYEASAFLAVMKACPPSLKRLKISDNDSLGYEEGEVPFLIDDMIYPCKNLERLELATNLMSSEIFRNLKDPLPLKKLIIGHEYDYHHYPTNCHQDYLLDLLNPRSKYHNSSIDELNLNLIEAGQIGRDASDREWLLPDWREGELDYLGLKALVELGTSFGVRMTGCTAEAVKVADAYVEYLTPCESSEDESSEGEGTESEEEEDKESDVNEESEEESDGVYDYDGSLISG